LAQFRADGAETWRSNAYRWANHMLTEIGPHNLNGKASRLGSRQMAMEFMAKLKARRTVRKPTGGGKLGPAFVSNEGSKKHCQLNPIWAADAFEGRWVDVPDDAVITELNRAGRTMIWPYTADRGTDHPHTEIRSCVPKTLSVDNATESPKLAE